MEQNFREIKLIEKCWKIGNVHVVVCDTLHMAHKKYDEFQHCGITYALFLITSSPGELLQELLELIKIDNMDTIISSHIRVAHPVIKVVSGIIEQKLLCYDMFDVLYENQKICDVCFQSGTIIFLKDCNLHKPKLKRDASQISTIGSAWCTVMLKNGSKEVAVKIDVDDLHFTKSHCMYVSTDKNTNYSLVRIKIENTTNLFSHILLKIVKLAPNMVVDHINRDSLDLRKLNLRIISCQRNAHNKTKSNGTSSIYIGVYANPDGTFLAHQSFNYKEYYLGRFKTEIEAAKANDKFSVFKYQDVTAQRNNVLTNDELKVALSTDLRAPICQVNSTFGVGIYKIKSKFQAVWRKDTKIFKKSFPSLQEAINHRDQQLNKIKLQKAQLIISEPIKRDIDGIAIITTNQKRGKQRDIQVDDDIYYELKKHNWNFTRDNPWAKITPTKRINMAEFVLNFHDQERKEGFTIDHLTQNHKNCQIQNLRFADKYAQAQNKKKKLNAKNTYIGVSRARTSQWRAELVCKSVRYYQIFNTEIEAANHYNILAKHFYDHPMLNPIPNNMIFPFSSFETSTTVTPRRNKNSKFRGVFPVRQKWCARIKVNGKNIEQIFNTEKEAAIHYNKLAQLYQKRPKLNVL